MEKAIKRRPSSKFLTPKKESQYNDISNGSSVADESIST